MVKLFTYSVLLLSLFLGCAAGIVDPPADLPGTAGEYFWPSTTMSATYTQQTLLTGARSTFTLNFLHDSTTFAQVTDNQGAQQFTYRINQEGVFLDSLAKVNLFLPLPDGFTFDSVATIYSTIYRPMKKVLVVDKSTMLAVDHQKMLFVTNNRGESWTKLPWQYGEIRTWTTDSKAIYIGTESGVLCTSIDKGLTWRPIITRGSPIRAIAPLDSFERVYYAAGDSVMMAVSITNAKDSVEMAAKSHLGQEVTSLAISGEYPNYYLTATTESGGIWNAATFLQPSIWKQATGLWKNCYGLVSLNQETLYALGNDNGEVKLIVSNTKGGSWAAATSTSLEGKPPYLAYTQGSLLAVTRNGKATKFSTSNINSRTEILGLHASEVYDLSAKEGVFAIATDSGIFISTTANVPWQNASNGPLVEKSQRTEHISSSLLLLKAGANALDSGNTWHAGKCHGTILGATVTYYITAKVSPRVDELSLDRLSGEKYLDVIPVQYIFSTTPGSTVRTDGAPRLVIYYAKGVGPVLLQQYIGGSLAIEMYRD